MLRDQIDNRLSAMADDRQALLMAGLLHLEERVRILTSRYRLLDVLDRHGGRGRFHAIDSKADGERTLDERPSRHATGLLAFWIEDQAGQTHCRQRTAASARPVSRRRKSSRGPQAAIRH